MISPSLPKIKPLPSHSTHAPFLVWPVTRREFYLSIQFALLPGIIWGTILFGWRVLIMLLFSIAAATLVHFLLKHFTRRGKRLVYAHSTLSVFIMVALCHPMWPASIVAAAAAVIPIILWILGGPGRERLLVPVAALILLQLLVIPSIPNLAASRGLSHAILAHDRLFTGDIRNYKSIPLYHWPSSLDLGGNDAVEMPQPQFIAFQALDQLSESLQSQTPSTTSKPAPLSTTRLLDDALSQQLPSIELLILGVVPGRIGTVSLAAILLGGLYLAYRHILRPRSVLLFLSTYFLGILLLLFWPSTILHVGLPPLWQVMKSFPSELLTLLQYATFNSDILFASVFILAIPGTEPLTSRGRRFFLITAALLAATLDRLNLNLPAATTSICLLMPLKPLFDRLFPTDSWHTRTP